MYELFCNIFECAVGSRRGSRTSCPVCPVDSISGINLLARAVERQTSEEEHSYNHKTGDFVFLRHWNQTWIIQQTTFTFVVLVQCADIIDLDFIILRNQKGPENIILLESESLPCTACQPDDHPKPPRMFRNHKSWFRYIIWPLSA